MPKSTIRTILVAAAITLSTLVAPSAFADDEPAIPDQTPVDASPDQSSAPPLDDPDSAANTTTTDPDPVYFMGGDEGDVAGPAGAAWEDKTRPPPDGPSAPGCGGDIDLSALKYIYLPPEAGGYHLVKGVEFKVVGTGLSRWLGRPSSANPYGTLWVFIVDYRGTHNAGEFNASSQSGARTATLTGSFNPYDPGTVVVKAYLRKNDRTKCKTSYTINPPGTPGAS